MRKSAKAVRPAERGIGAGKGPISPGEEVSVGKRSRRRKKYSVLNESLPDSYGETWIALMAVDPRKLFVFWEIMEDVMPWVENSLTLRFYYFACPTSPIVFCDITAAGKKGRQYLEVVPGRDYYVEIGVLTGKKFHRIAGSLSVQTPPHQNIEVVDLDVHHPPGEVRPGYSAT